MFVKVGVQRCHLYKKYYRRYFSNRNILKLKERGMFQDIFPDNAAIYMTDLLNSGPQTVYAGFDPTADSLHVGNLLVLLNLLHWQRGGHHTIALVGGATAKIGDPSGRKTEREEISKVFVDDNIAGIRKNIETVFSNHEKYFWNDSDTLTPVRIVNNEDWYNNISAVELIGSAGRHLRMGTLLSRKSVQTRLNSAAGMSLTEFSYQLFQAYDWLHLFKNYGCTFQIGGNDQMGNIMSGHELISKVCNKQVCGLTLPLVTAETGDKFGKSAGNAVWLSPHRTSPFAFYQFWMRQPDAAVERLLKLFTFDTSGAVADLMRQHRERPERRLAQRRLADSATLLAHSEAALAAAKGATAALYEGGAAALGAVAAADVEGLFEGATVVEVLPEAGETVLGMAMRTGCFPTIQDAVRIISAGGFYINQQRASNVNEVLNMSVHKLQNNITLLRVGKRNYYIVKWLS